jgi:hypothetical protein
MRPHKDPALSFVDQFIVPVGQGPSKWLDIGEEWLDARDRVGRIATHAVSDGRSYLKAEFEWSKDNLGPSRLEVTANVVHPDLGSGLCLHLQMPVLMPSLQRAHTAVELNLHERAEWNWCHDLGSWCVEGSELAFRAFVPNVSFCPGLMSGLAHDMAIRAEWANNHLQRGDI